jgi:hypothetical protein
MKDKKSFATKFIEFYRDGFKNMTVGRTLWFIALLKLFIMFAILKVFFFPNLLKEKFDNDSDRGNYVSEQLVEKSK